MTVRRLLVLSGLALFAGAVVAVLRQSVELAPMEVEIRESLLRASVVPVEIEPGRRSALFKDRLLDEFRLLEVPLQERSRPPREVYRSRDNPVSIHLSPSGTQGVFQERSAGGSGFETSLLDLADGRRCTLPIPPLETALPPLRWSPSGEGLAFYHERFGHGGIGLLSPVRCDSSPRLFVARAAVDASFEWSHDGRHLFVTEEGTPPVIRRIGVEGDEEARVALPGPGVVMAFAVSDDDSRILAEFIPYGEAKKRLVECGVSSGSCTLSNAPAGAYAPHFFDGAEEGAHLRVSPFEIVRIVRNGDGSWTPDSSESGIEQYLGPGLDRGSIFVRAQSLCGGGRIEKRPVAVVAGPPEHGCPEYKKVPVPPTREDPSAEPYLLWEPRGTRRGLVLIVDGHPYQFDQPAWGPALPELVKQGIAVLAVDYLGDADWEWDPDLDAVRTLRGRRVARALDYATHELAVPRSRIAIFGVSYAGNLAAETSTQRDGPLGAMVLVGPDVGSWKVSDPSSLPERIAVFQGARDELVGAGANRRQFDLLVQARGERREARFTALEGEAHTPKRISSWTAILSTLARFALHE